MDAAFVRTISRILNAFENDSGSPETDYRHVYIYRDGNNKRQQVTLARGFTSDGGNLQKVLARYVQKKGAQSAFMWARIRVSTPNMVADKEFLKMLGTVSTEPAMREAQNEIFEEAYLNPALVWARDGGFVLPLSVGVVVDSFLHSGTMLKKLTSSFSEHKPAAGGDEKKWIEGYLHARGAWFQRATGELHNCTYRPLFFLGEITKGNWSLALPLRANGSAI